MIRRPAPREGEFDRLKARVKRLAWANAFLTLALVGFAASVLYLFFVR